MWPLPWPLEWWWGGQLWQPWWWTGSCVGVSKQSGLVLVRGRSRAYNPVPCAGESIQSLPEENPDLGGGERKEGPGGPAGRHCGYFWWDQPEVRVSSAWNIWAAILISACVVTLVSRPPSLFIFYFENLQTYRKVEKVLQGAPTHILHLHSLIIHIIFCISLYLNRFMCHFFPTEPSESKLQTSMTFHL